MRTVHSQLLNKYEEVLHAFSTKEGGYSCPPFAENNLAYHVNDNPLDVDKNHLSFSHYLNYDPTKLMHMHQVHSDTVHIITHESQLSDLPACDALITQEKAIPLMVMVADCIPVLLYDPIEKVIAVVHAGRAGIFKNLLTKTIQTMHNNYGTKPTELITVLGPSIRQCCYEVGKEIYEEAKTLAYDHAIESKQNHFYLDLIKIAKVQLKTIGVKEHNIDTLTYCTSCHKDLFFSYRAEQNITGRFSGIIMLR